jgi:hypothetical protein
MWEESARRDGETNRGFWEVEEGDEVKAGMSKSAVHLVPGNADDIRKLDTNEGEEQRKTISRRHFLCDASRSEK